MLESVLARIGILQLTDVWASYLSSQRNLLRRLAIFAVCFVGTRNLVVSVLLTAGFVILAGGLFRGSSVYSREGMHNSPDRNLRSRAGLVHCDQPAYDTKEAPMF